MDSIHNYEDEVVIVTPEDGVAIMEKLATLGSVGISTRRSGWSCDVWVGEDAVSSSDEDNRGPTVRGYGYQHGPHGAAATALAKLQEMGLA